MCTFVINIIFKNYIKKINGFLKLQNLYNICTFRKGFDKKWFDAIMLWVDALCVSCSAILCTLLDSGGKLTSSITRFYTWGKNRGKVIFPSYVVIIIQLYIVKVVMVIEF